MRSWIYKKVGDFKSGHDAINYYTKAIKLDPNYIEAYYKRGLAKYEIGHYKRCIKDNNKAIALDPTHTEAYYQRGLARYEIGEYKEAIDDFWKGYRARPQ